MAKNVKRDIDFLEVYQAKKTIHINKNQLVYILIPTILVFIIAFTSIFMIINNNKLDKEVTSMQQQIEELIKTTQSDTTKNQQQEMIKLQNQINNLTKVEEILTKYTKIDQATMLKIKKSCKNLTIKTTNFKQETGELVFTVEATKVNGCEETVRTLRATGLFKSVDYAGYNQDGGVVSSVQTVTDPVTGIITNETVTNQIPVIYKSTIKCILEGGN